MARRKSKLPDDGPDPIDISVGLRIRTRRKELRITQTELAEHIGVSFQQLQKYELGVNRISSSALVRAAEKLKCTVAFLVGEDSASAPSLSDDIFAQLSERGATELLNIYVQLPDPKSRRLLLDVARAIAGKSE